MELDPADQGLGLAVRPRPPRRNGRSDPATDQLPPGRARPVRAQVKGEDHVRGIANLRGLMSGLETSPRWLRQARRPTPLPARSGSSPRATSRRSGFYPLSRLSWGGPSCCSSTSLPAASTHSSSTRSTRSSPRLSGEGRTVFLSSHNLPEVEALCAIASRSSGRADSWRSSTSRELKTRALREDRDPLRYAGRRRPSSRAFRE